MFDRVALYCSVDDLAKAFVVEVQGGYKPSYNAGPGQLLPVITSDEPRGVSYFYWGLMAKWSNNKSISRKTVNLSASDSFQKRNYQRQLTSHRCIIPINGFYAWKKVSKKQLIPHYVQSPDESLMAIPALWEEFEDFDGMTMHSFRILLIPSSRGMEDFGPEMPALFTPDQGRNWLEDAEMDVLRQKVTARSIEHPNLNSVPVSPKISDLENNYPSLILKETASDQHGNYTLFS